MQQPLQGIYPGAAVIILFRCYVTGYRHTRRQGISTVIKAKAAKRKMLTLFQRLAKADINNYDYLFTNNVK